MNTEKDMQFMQRALELARKGLGRTSPNPMVGAVVVKNGRILAEGYHKKAGTDHAEICALKNLSRAQTQGATLYVTLEPCCHTGRTPPCADALIAAGLRTVVIGTRDPNPLVSGKGIRTLRKAGIRIKTGVLEKECRELNRFFFHWIKHQRPFVILKAGLSLDGKIATAKGESKWITSESSRLHGHALRSQVDAILVGAGTIKKDRPQLTARLPGHRNIRQPKVVILSRKKLADIPENTVRIDNGRNLPRLLNELGRQGMTSLLVEGGAKVASSFLKAGLVDQIVACIAPKILGGGARDWLPDLKIQKLANAIQLFDVHFLPAGDNMIVEAYVHRNH